MAGIYRQRHPERTVFYRVMFHYFEEFVSEYENRFEREYGYFRPVINKVVDNIIGHLKLRFQPERPPPPQVVQQELLMAAEESGEYF